MDITATYRADLISLVERVRERTRRSDSAISRAVFGNDHGFVRRLKDGDNFTVDKAARLEQWLQAELAAANAALLARAAAKRDAKAA
jgi:hypothetical protein